MKHADRVQKKDCEGLTGQVTQTWPLPFIAALGHESLLTTPNFKETETTYAG
jgi:hypothetical protein